MRSRSVVLITAVMCLLTASTQAKEKRVNINAFEKQFELIQKDMTRFQVEGMLGKPALPGDASWAYSFPDHTYEVQFQENVVKQTRHGRVIGATAKPFQLGMKRVDLSFDIALSTEPRRLVLIFENMTSDTPAPAYDIYVNLPTGDAPDKQSERFVDRMAFYGLVEATRAMKQGTGEGLFQTSDITSLIDRLKTRSGWDSHTLIVTIIPNAKGWEPAAPVQVNVQRVSLWSWTK